MRVFLIRRVISLVVAVIALCVGDAWGAISKASTPVGNLKVVHGVVVTPSGKPIGGAYYVVCVLADDPSKRQATSADASGRFKFMLKAGRYEMWVQGAKINKVELVVGPRSPLARVKITGRANQEITLTFQKPDGRPAARSRIHPDSNGVLNTDERGRARIRASFDAPRRFLLVSPGLGYGEFGFDDDSHLYNTSSLTIRLHAGGTVTGTVRDDAGRPVGGQEIYPVFKMSKDDPWGSFWNAMLHSEIKGVHVSAGPVAAVSRDGDGRYLIQSLIPGDYELKVGYEGETARQFSINDRESTHTFDITVPSQKDAKSISGRVLWGTARKPLANTEVVFVTRLDQTRADCDAWHYVKRQFVTDDQGTFRLYPLEPGVYWITASTPSYGVSERRTVDVSRRREAYVDVVLTGGARR